LLVLNKKYKTVKSLLNFSIIFLVILPTLGIGFLTFFNSKDIISKKIATNTIDAVEQINLNIEKEAVNIDNYIDLTIMNSNIQDVLSNSNFKNYDYNLKKVFENFDDFLRNMFIKNSSIDNVLLVSSKGGFYRYREMLYLDENDLRKSDWYSETIKLGGKINWIGTQKSKSIINSNNYVFNVSRAILSKETFRFIGVIYLSINESMFQPILSKIPASQTLYVVNQSGYILVSSDKHALGTTLGSFDTNIPSGFQSGSFFLKEKGDKYLFVYSNLNKYGWRVINKIPIKTLTKEIDKIRNFTFIIMICCLTVFAVFMYIVYSNLTRPLRYLVSFINEIESGNDRIDLKKFPCYDLLRINNGIVSLIEKNKDTAMKLETTEILRQKTELAKLQANVNPHFLYNTLNSIKYIALKNDQVIISNLITSLVKLLRNSIGREGDFISIHDEVENLQHYIAIQSIVYNNKIQFIFENDEKLNDMMIPNFILQPLVENSIFHGIDPNNSQSKIIIRNYKDDCHIIFEVEDNGKGMEESTISQILNKRGEKNGFSNIGIIGIKEKLQLIYGIGCDLQIKSIPGEGTRITIKIPLSYYNGLKSCIG
jgi:Predicted signal transduction protein with a C-terminal ATPase domain